MNITYPRNALTGLARAFMPQDNTANNLKTQAYVMAAASNRDRDTAAADLDKQKTAELTARNQARTPEALQSAALAGMGMSPQAQPAMDLAEAFRTGRNPMTPAVQGQPALELPSMDTSQLGNLDLGAVMSNPNISLDTVAPAIQGRPAVERPVDQGQLGELARRMGDFMGMNAATGDTNYQQLQAGVGQRMENEILQKAVSGQQLTPQEMALLKASSVYNGQGINSYDGTGGEAFDTDQTNTIGMNNDDNATSRSNNAASNATSRRNNTDDNAAAMTRHTTPGASSSNDSFKIRDDIRAQYNVEFPVDFSGERGSKGSPAPSFDQYERQQLKRLNVDESSYYGTPKTAPTATPKKQGAGYQNYLKAYNSAKGNPTLQKQLTDLARKNGDAK